jgi:hypothetical protein
MSHTVPTTALFDIYAVLRLNGAKLPIATPKSPHRGVVVIIRVES